VVVATPTASGKSLYYHLPIVHRMSQEASCRTLYFFPTKALSVNQKMSLQALMRDAKLSRTAITYDGDTSVDAWRAAWQDGAVIITDPDMLHHGILPHHTSCAWFTFPNTYLDTLPASPPEIRDALIRLARVVYTLAPLRLMTEPREIDHRIGERDIPEPKSPAPPTHPNLIQPTVFIYDQTPGGVGLAKRIFTLATELSGDVAPWLV
jgi:ATP-dependent helicase YprA (DUF1998 family)